MPVALEVGAVFLAALASSPHWQMPPASRKKKGQAPKDVDTKSSDDEGSGVRIGEGFEVEPFNGKRALKLILIFVFIANTKQILNRLLAEAKYWMGWD